jgi:hypothetical protein
MPAQPRPQRQALGPLALGLLLGVADAPAQVLPMPGPALDEVQVLAPDPGEPPQADCLAFEAGSLPRPRVPVLARTALVRGEPVQGTVRATFRFTRPNRAPQARVLHTEADSLPLREAYAQSVLDHAQDLRLPCLPLEADSLSLVREFRFTPQGEPHLFALLGDLQDPRNKDMPTCLVHLKDPPQDGAGAALPMLPVQGRVLVQARFVAPDQPPEVQAWMHVRAEALRPIVMERTEHMRLPCLEGPPLDVPLMFSFHFQPGHYGFKDLTLPQLLRQGRRSGQPQRWDTQAMGCPFDIQLQYRRPVQPNIVRELQPAHPQRQALLQHLVSLELDLSPIAGPAMFGALARVHVPCGSFASR